jgi:hypothetical protein
LTIEPFHKQLIVYDSYPSSEEVVLCHAQSIKLLLDFRLDVLCCRIILVIVKHQLPESEEMVGIEARFSLFPSGFENGAEGVASNWKLSGFFEVERSKRVGLQGFVCTFPSRINLYVRRLDFGIVKVLELFP